ncbi:MAG: hypothetical protein M1814_002963 [Vezdaea aestivalis]|nr:MAG: hypothetical protein M1814_002963 [Vezdaea aestivalis]
MLTLAIGFSLLLLGTSALSECRLRERSITIPGALDKGMTIKDASVVGLDNDSPMFAFTIFDELGKSRGLQTNFKRQSGSYKVTLPTTNYIACDNPEMGFNFTSYINSIQPGSNTPNYGPESFVLSISHTINVNGGPALRRHTGYSFTSFDFWANGSEIYTSNVVSVYHPITCYNNGGLKLANLPTLTDPAPAGWFGDAYTIDAAATPPVYDREAEHYQILQAQKSTQSSSSYASAATSTPTSTIR